MHQSNLAAATWRRREGLAPPSDACTEPQLYRLTRGRTYTSILRFAQNRCAAVDALTPWALAYFPSFVDAHVIERFRVLFTCGGRNSRQRWI